MRCTTRSKFTPVERRLREGRAVRLKVGKIPYLNSVLFYHPLETNPDTRDELELVPMVPSQLSAAAVGGGIDAGPVPLVTSFDLSGAYEPLGDFCIATVDKAVSILLFSKVPPGKLNGATVGITDETSTSVRLLKALFAHHYGVTPGGYKPLDGPNDAFLLIGDSALRNRGGREGYPFTTDLGEVWRKATGLPFVFAAWMMRSSLSGERKRHLETVVGEALEQGWARLESAVEPRLDGVGMSTAEARAYLEGFHFRMGAPEREAVGVFREMDAATRNSERTGSPETAGRAEVPE
jgi:chorismate dehydratase